MTSATCIRLPQKGLRLARRPTDSIHPAKPRPQRRDCQGQLRAALEALAGPACAQIETRLRPWCSATFIGARHDIELVWIGAMAHAQASAMAAQLPEAELPLSGHIVADVEVGAVTRGEDGAVHLCVGLLTIEDW